MQEVIGLKCGNKNISDIAKFLKRAGQYLESGYELTEFSTEEGLEAYFCTKEPRSIGFKIEEDESDN